MQHLKGKIAVVTGASRGAGRGIALVLGEEGATVYVTGRSVQGGPTTDDLPGTVDQTAKEVTLRGGEGIPVHCDHTVEAEIKTLFERVKQEQGRLDLLVNNVWGGYEQYTHESFGQRFWEQPLSRWSKMVSTGIWATVATTYFAVRLLMRSERGLVVNTGFRAGWDDWESPKGLPLFYDVQKVASNRATLGMAEELKEQNIAVVGLGLPWMRTERMMRDTPPSEQDLAKTASIFFAGRAVVALASDSDILRKSRDFIPIEELSQEYDFTDIDGTKPAPL
ncbi:SDR family NAD(P)-dependent oxidoreductase [Candidatus Poribacteria bacterium]|nr:SDR family NAD(P)-dependent oxidoreductase [Candidatus Poribacteria bacterium]